MITRLLLAIGLVLVLEGALYALFAPSLKKFFTRVNDLSDVQLRVGGLFALAVGVALIWFLEIVL